MSEERLNEITHAFHNVGLRWAMRWCDADLCACMGCANIASRVNPNKPSVHPEIQPHLIPPITKAEWQEWWRIQGERLEGTSP